MNSFNNKNYNIFYAIPYFIVFSALILIILPQLIIFISSFNSTSELAFPPKGFSVKWYINILEREAFLVSMKLSLILASCSTLSSIIIAFLFSLAIVRYNFIGRNLLNSLILCPIIIPEVVTGISFLYLYNKLKMYDILINLFILHILLTLPYSVRVISASLYRFDISIEEAAMSLGANKLKTLIFITIPLIKPALIVSAIFCFIISFDNFTATLFLVTHKTTLPIEIFAYIRTENDPTVAAISSFFILITITMVLIAQKYFGLHKFIK